jgi:type IV pilus assembly protein PilC
MSAEATYVFEAMDAVGETTIGQMRGASAAQVTAELRNRHLTVLDVKEKGRELRLPLSSKDKVKTRELAVFTRQLATMLRSGLVITRALRTIANEAEEGRLREAVVGVLGAVEAGESLHVAMADYPDVFGALYRAIVARGETTGKLDVVLPQLARHLEKMDSLRRQLRAGLMYPGLVFGFAGLVMVGVTAFIVPIFLGLYEDMKTDGGIPADTELPFLTQITKAVSDTLTGRWYVLIAIAVIAAVAFTRWKRTESGRYHWDALKLRIPLRIGDVIHKVALARWSRTFADTVAAGVPMLNGIQLTRAASGNAVIEEAMDELYEAVKRGGSITKTIAAQPVFPNLVTEMVSAGEESGDLEAMLEQVATYYEDETDATVKGLTSLIEPVLIILIGGVVGFIVISMYLPILSLYDQMR